MRWIFLSLVLMNLAYLGYEMSKPQEVESVETVDVSLVSTGAPIKLISEVQGVKPRVVSQSQAVKDPLCWAVGPYKVELDAKHSYARLLAVDLEAKVTPQPVVVKEEFWVYLPPLPNKKQAIRKLKELQKRKVDSFVITEGELANGISLGLFSKKESVDRLLAGLKKKNITPTVKTMQRTRDQYWVISPVLDNELKLEKTRDRLLDGRNMEWRQILCKSELPAG